MRAAVTLGLAVAAVVGIGLRAARRHRVRQRLATVLPGSASGAVPEGALVGWLGARLAAADLALSPERAVRWWAAGLVAGPLVWLGLGAVAGTLGLLALVGGPPLGLWLARGRRADRLDRELPAELDRLASAVRSGAAVRGALEDLAAEPREGGPLGATDRRFGRRSAVAAHGRSEVPRAPAAAHGGRVDGRSAVARSDRAEVPTAPAAAALAGLGADLRQGRPFAEAVDAFAARHPSPATSLVATSLVLAATAGGSPARALDGAACTLHERREAERDLRAAAAQARLSALVISLAPLGFGLLAAGTDPRVPAFLLGSPAGVTCLLVGLGLDAVAAWWMHRIVAEPR